MILIDTSVWVDHFRSANARLAVLASQLELVQHPFVTGELAMGNLADSRRTVDALTMLPPAEVVEEIQFLQFLESHALAGSGLGFVDAHLLACAVQREHIIWTRDKRLALQAQRLQVEFRPTN